MTSSRKYFITLISAFSFIGGAMYFTAPAAHSATPPPGSKMHCKAFLPQCMGYARYCKALHNRPAVCKLKYKPSIFTNSRSRTRCGFSIIQGNKFERTSAQAHASGWLGKILHAGYSKIKEGASRVPGLKRLLPNHPGKPVCRWIKKNTPARC